MYYPTLRYVPLQRVEFAESKSELSRPRFVLIPSFVLFRWDLSFAHCVLRVIPSRVWRFGLITLRI